jgi:NAD(P)H-hydrate epimerase
MPDQAQRLVFRTEEGTLAPAVTADEMREVDRVAVEDFGLTILQMMENAGRNLVQHALEMLGGPNGEVTILAGAGGNGGGGLYCARHLHNQRVRVWVLLAREESALGPAARNQLRILSVPGDLYLADIGIPPEVFHQVGLQLEIPFGTGYHTRLEPVDRV